jgi:hypothetical protein
MPIAVVFEFLEESIDNDDVWDSDVALAKFRRALDAAPEERQLTGRPELCLVHNTM